MAQSEDKRSVSIVIVGAGYMGTNALNGLLNCESKGLLSFKPEIRGIVDISEGALATAKELLSARPHSCEFVEKLSDLSGTLRDAAAPLVVYDGAGIATRFDNLVYVHQQRRDAFFFGEKPFTLSQWESQYEKHINTDRVFCDFLEVRNPVVIAVDRELRERNLTILSATFWRSSPAGIRHFLGLERAGVQGGSLIDKAPHDLSIAHALIGGGGECRGEVTASRFSAFLLHSQCRSGAKFKESPTPFLTVNGGVCDYSAQRIRDVRDCGLLPADLACQFEVRWRPAGTAKSIPTKFLSGWAGIAHTPNELALLDFVKKTLPEEEVAVYYDQEIDEPKARVGEVRLMIAKLSDNSTLIASFLSRNGQSAKRFAAWCQNDETPIYWHKETPLANEIESKGIEMSEMFEALLNGEARYFGAHAIRDVHDVMLSAQKKALDEIATRRMDTSALFNVSAALIAKNFQ